MLPCFVIIRKLFKPRAFLCAAFLILIATDEPVQATIFNLENKCPFTVWPASQPNAGKAVLENGGFALYSGHSKPIEAPPQWSGKFWGRSGCRFDSAGQGVCDTGSCAPGLQCAGHGLKPPATVADFTLSNNPSTRDFYDVSLVDGFNLPLRIQPSDGACEGAGCSSDVNSVCPEELKVRNSGGQVVACESACGLTGAPIFCCTGSYSTPSTCPSTLYSRLFKSSCPKTFTYAYDHLTSLFTCASADTHYTITFCPQY